MSDMAKKNISLRTLGNVVIEVGKAVAMKFLPVKNFFGDDDDASSSRECWQCEWSCYGGEAPGYEGASGISL